MKTNILFPYKHQEDLFKKGIEIIRKYGLVYFACEERTGKTLPAIMMCEELKVYNILILTKKKALPGWHHALGSYPHNKTYYVTNYHQAKKLTENYDLIILDEAHSYLSAFPKPSQTWKIVRKLCVGKPIIYLSATPFAQGHHLLYHQLALSDFSPWRKMSSAIAWFAKYGIPHRIMVNQRLVETYTKSDPSCFKDVKHLFITLKRKDIGFEFEPEDKLHYVELTSQTKEVYNYLLRHKAMVINKKELVCDSSMKLRTALHSIEGGTVILSKKKGDKIVREYVVLGNTEKIDYIKQHFGDTLGMVIMYHYKAELNKLGEHFKLATLLQATSYAEGIDLMNYDHLIIYSQDWSTAKHTQRRARQANRLRAKEIIVHYLLVKDAISDEVYNAVSVNKKNYVDKLFKNREL